MIDKPLFTIGRSHNNDLCLPFMYVSREHAQIAKRGNQFVIEDLKSKHGTFLNGTKIDWATLQDSDRIAIGGPNGIKITVGGKDVFSSLLSRSEKTRDGKGFKDIANLLDSFQTLNASFEIEELLNLIVDEAIELSNADRGLIMLTQPDSKLHFVSGRGRQRQNVEFASFSVSRRVPEESMRTQQTVVIQDFTNDLYSKGHDTTRWLGLKSVCCVPLRLGRIAQTLQLTADFRPESLGVLYLDSWSAVNAFKGDVLKALETIAYEASMAIDKARKYKESLEKKKAEGEQHFVREIQRQLMPTLHHTRDWVEVASAYVPCRDLGGDYTDLLELPDDKLGLVIAEVSGKGTPAALITCRLQGLLAANALLDVPLLETISNVNRALQNQRSERRLITLFYGILSRDGKLTYINAGHNPPLLLQQDKVKRLETGGLILGLARDAHRIETVAVKPGDLLVLFTDGLTQAQNPAGDEFGEERVIERISAHRNESSEELAHLVVDELQRFCKGTPLMDDVTIMVVKINPALG
jgi:serine phosphatase RsbU (regulator of sigma subunit)